MRWTGWATTFLWFERLTFPARLRLIEHGKMDRRNMRRELITVAELMAHLRESGIEEVADVKAAYMEGDGQISVVRYSEGEAPRKRRRPSRERRVI